MQIKHFDETRFSRATIHWLYTRKTRDSRFGDYELYRGDVSPLRENTLGVDAKPVDPKKGCPFRLTIRPRQAGLQVEFSCNDCSGPITDAEFFRDHPGDDVIVTFSTDVEKVWVYLRSA